MDDHDLVLKPVVTQGIPHDLRTPQMMLFWSWTLQEVYVGRKASAVRIYKYSKNSKWLLDDG